MNRAYQTNVNKSRFHQTPTFHVGLRIARRGFPEKRRNDNDIRVAPHLANLLEKSGVAKNLFTERQMFQP